MVNEVLQLNFLVVGVGDGEWEVGGVGGREWGCPSEHAPPATSLTFRVYNNRIGPTRRPRGLFDRQAAEGRLQYCTAGTCVSSLITGKGPPVWRQSL